MTINPFIDHYHINVISSNHFTVNYLAFYDTRCLCRMTRDII